MDTRREFLKKASLLSAGGGLLHVLPASIAKALAIDPVAGSTYLDAEHIVLLMQENRSFDHTYGTLRGVRGFNDPRAIRLPDKNLVWLQTNKEGETYAPFRFDIKDTKITWMSSLPHSWANQVDARNNGKYDKWLDVKHSGTEEYAAMPLTMGYYTRKDIPFYYSLADAFTICDQHFCSSLTGTTPNRLFFWTGTIREKQNGESLANVWNEDADYDTMVSWSTFPERLEEEGISWKIYQNELSVGVGFEGEEDGWLANFGDNALEYFKQYHVKMLPEYIANLPKEAIQLAAELKKRENQLPSLQPGSEELQKINFEIAWIKKRMATNAADQLLYTKESYEQLTAEQKSLFQKAFSTNREDPYYHQLASLTYKDGGVQREVKVPKGDILHQFRKDVTEGALPTVSWLVAPENFSDHPSSAWYGAWYISEVMDILTQNPEVWKKTIFILTYDENDGYFDHVPPFTAPHPLRKDTGRVSNHIDTSADYVTSSDQQSIKDQARESPIGLGFRVPLVIASPWSRGGWVNSEVFDHTSSLQLMEKFLSHKKKKEIEEDNISAWRRTICGDLSSVFRPYNGEKISNPEFLERDAFIESIHKAQFKNPPADFRKLSPAEISAINKNPNTPGILPVQESGIRPSCALPYELYADGKLSDDKKTIDLFFQSAANLFGDASAGCPFQVYAPGVYRQEAVRVWSYAVAAGDTIKDSWSLADFENGQYHLQVYGPNGFFRELTGNEHDPMMGIDLLYEHNASHPKQLTGNIVLHVTNNASQPAVIEITDNAYKTNTRTQTIGGGNTKKEIRTDLSKSYGWYDFTISIKGNQVFRKRYAGRVETGKPGKTDPFMGRVI